jgi:hypothetical protein
MCEHEGQPCPGRSCRCVCDNCVLGPDKSDIEVECMICYPFACDDPDRHLGVPSEYTPLANIGCHCGADLDGRDCMCFED